MSEEAPLPADPVAAYDRALSEFARELRVLRINCGKPSQVALVKGAAARATGPGNASFRLNSSTLSQVFNGRVLPSHDFLSALIRQLSECQPGFPYDKHWPQWRKRWTQLQLLREASDRYLLQLQADQKAHADEAARAGELVRSAQQEAQALLARAPGRSGSTDGCPGPAC